MKILQINSVCTGSTGRVSIDLANLLKREGHECFIAYGQGNSSYENSFKFGSRFENLVHALFFTRILGLHGHGSIIGTMQLVRWIKKFRPDIIHLCSLHANYINYPILFKFLITSKIPVIMTLHDCFNYTGKCSHYTSQKCNKWKEQCGHCQFMKHSIGESWFFDNTRKLFNEKKRWYEKIERMTVVGVSQWIAKEAQQSMLAHPNHKITHIYNWIDETKFNRPNEDYLESIRQKYGLKKQYKYLISVSQGWNQNSTRYIDAIKLSSILPTDYKIVLVGDVSQGMTIPENILHISFIGNSKELSAVYSIAEAYIHLSVADSFGKVIAEAMSCGTVPITFDSTACGEVPGPYGIVVKPHDVDAIVESLPRIEEMKANREAMIQYVRDNYDYQTNAHRYIELYKELIGLNK